MLTPYNHNTVQVWLHGQFHCLVSYVNLEEFFKIVAKKLLCSVEDVIIVTGSGVEYRNCDAIPPFRGTLVMAYNCPIPATRENFNQKAYAMDIVVNEVRQWIGFDSQEDLLEILKEKLGVPDVRDVALANPNGKVYKLWNERKSKDAKRFIKHAHLFAFKKR